MRNFSFSARTIHHHNHSFHRAEGTRGTLVLELGIKAKDEVQDIRVKGHIKVQVPGTFQVQEEDHQGKQSLLINTMTLIVSFNYITLAVRSSHPGICPGIFPGIYLGTYQHNISYTSLKDLKTLLYPFRLLLNPSLWVIKT